MTQETQNTEVILDQKAEASAPALWWLMPLATVVIGATALVGSFAVYHQYFAVKPMRLAVLDINFILEAKELEFTSVLSRPGVTDADRKAALERVAKIEPELRRVVAEVRKECGCEILVKAAAISSEQILDVTGTVAARMQINEASVAGARKDLLNALEASPLITGGPAAVGAKQ